MVGVAYRGHIPLEEIAAEFEVGMSTVDGLPRTGVWETITVKGDLTDEHLLRLKRASRFCPRGQDFTQRNTVVDDQVAFMSGDREPRVLNKPGPSTTDDHNGAALMFPPGKVHSLHLRETREWGGEPGRPTLAHEGQVVVYFAYEREQDRPHRWAVLGGHTSAGWGPSPVDFHNGALAASTVATLRTLVAPDPLGHDDLIVTVESEPHGGRGRTGAQQTAAEGEVRRQRRITRRVMAGGPLSEVPAEAIRNALKSDPLYRFIQNGDILLGDRMVHERVG